MVAGRPRIQQAVYGGQWTAVTVVPIWFVGMTVVAGGGLPFGAFVMLAIPIGVLLAAPPTVGRFIGRMRAPVDVTTSYAITTVATWAACFAFGLALAVGPGADGGNRGTSWMFPVVCATWLAQTATGLLARWRTGRS